MGVPHPLKKIKINKVLKKTLKNTLKELCISISGDLPVV